MGKKIMEIIVLGVRSFFTQKIGKLIHVYYIKE